MAHPLCQLCLANRLQIAQKRCLKHSPVAADIVTAQDRDWLSDRLIPTAKRAAKIGVDGALFAALPLRGDDRVLKIQLSGVIKIIAAFRDRDADGMNAVQRHKLLGRRRVA